MFPSEYIEALSSLPFTHFPDHLLPFNGVSTNTKTIKPQDLFIAIKGENQDGHNYIEEAFQKGASVVISEKSFPGCVCVSSSKKALWALAHYKRIHTKAHIIGVTGSVGKTSTKEILSHVLSHFGKTISSPKSFNNDLGVPLTLMMLQDDTEFAIVEMGTNHRYEIASLTSLVQPDSAIITALALAHAEGLKDLETIRLEKSDIFSKNPLYGFMPETFFDLAESVKNPFIVNCLETRYENNLTFIKGKVGEKIFKYQTSLPPHLAKNTLYVVGVANQLGLDLSLVFNILKTIMPFEGRGQEKTCTLHNKTLYIFDDSYNANPTSMKAGLESFFLKTQGKRRFAILGDMLELGSLSKDLHLEIDLSSIDKVFCCGEFMKTKYETLSKAQQGFWAPTSNDLIGPLLHEIKNNDALFFKGSKGSFITKVVSHLISLSS